MLDGGLSEFVLAKGTCCSQRTSPPTAGDSRFGSIASFRAWWPGPLDPEERPRAMSAVPPNTGNARRSPTLPSRADVAKRFWASERATDSKL